jgi:hypothetical protein
VAAPKLGQEKGPQPLHVGHGRGWVGSRTRP